MSTSSHDARGNLALTILRVGVLVLAGGMVGVLAHVAWRLISG